MQQVNCSDMSIKHIKLAVYPDLEVLNVVFNTAHLDWQLTPNNNESSWLWWVGIGWGRSLVC
jgi:hypothetical protein